MVVRRPVFDGQKQRTALETFQKDAGIDATTAAKSVGLSYPQYNRYLWGRVPLRTDQIATFAAAYRVSSADLSRALGLMDETPSATSEPVYTLDDMRAELLAAGLPDDMIAEALDAGRDQPALSRKGIALAWRHQWAKDVAKLTAAEKPRRRTG